eukprot:TRINITY_DN5725_c0_g1_i8.p1 TRINITY_DN5725_c0_g1~~TRINITY_DN5725_c0_g1_i8.p1  ORF type:complete len:199 (+),score=51.25 TRINITY_DN5725_c0_g1_i8:245-841(+)
MAKVVIVGDGAVGKTCLLDRVNKANRVDWDDPEYLPTAAGNFSVTWFDGDKQYDIEIWDTAGQEALGHLRQVAYAETDLFLIAYDMSQPVSLENVTEKWIKEIEECVEQTAEPRYILVGTKHDLWQGASKQQDELDQDWLQAYEVAQQIKASHFVSTSAKTDHGVNPDAVSYTHLRAHETPEHLVCRLLLEKKKKKIT